MSVACVLCSESKIAGNMNKETEAERSCTSKTVSYNPAKLKTASSHHVSPELDILVNLCLLLCKDPQGLNILWLQGRRDPRVLHHLWDADALALVKVEDLQGGHIWSGVGAQ